VRSAEHPAGVDDQGGSLECAWANPDTRNTKKEQNHKKQWKAVGSKGP